LPVGRWPSIHSLSAGGIIYHSGGDKLPKLFQLGLHIPVILRWWFNTVYITLFYPTFQKFLFTNSFFVHRILRRQIAKLVFVKSRAHAKFKSSHLLSDNNKFSLLHGKLKFLLKQCYRNFVSRTESTLLRNPRYFWSFIRKNNSTLSIPSSIIFDDIQVQIIPRPLTCLLNIFFPFSPNHLPLSVQLYHGQLSLSPTFLFLQILTFRLAMSTKLYTLFAI